MGCIDTKIISHLPLDAIYGRTGFLPLLRCMNTLNVKYICDPQERAICEVTGDKFGSSALSSISDSLSVFIKGEKQHILIHGVDKKIMCTDT